MAFGVIELGGRMNLGGGKMAIVCNFRGVLRCLWDSHVETAWRLSDTLLGTQERAWAEDKFGGPGLWMVMKALSGHSFI